MKGGHEVKVVSTRSSVVTAVASAPSPKAASSSGRDR